MHSKRVEWSDLPKELWTLIAKRLNTTLDVLRFRSICKSWRSAISLPLPSSHSLFPPQTLIPLPSLYSSSDILFPPLQTLIPFPQFSLLQTKIYRLELSPSSQQHPSISSLSSKGWIIKVRESKSIPFRLLNPFTNFRLSPPPNTSPKVLNLLNFRFVELIETCTINYASGFLSTDEDELEEGVFMLAFYVRKLVLYPPSFDVEGRMVFALYEDGKLGVFKMGGEKWNFLGDGNSHYDDMILHRGQLYVVDKLGTIFWVDCSSLKLVQFYHKLRGFGTRTYLVESGGSLYVVDMKEKRDNFMGLPHEVVDVKVYTLDEESGRWFDVKNLGDVVFVLGKDCNFSLSAQDYHGCEGNCVYFYSQGRACAFSLDNSKFKSPNPFWPCPTLFNL